MDIDEGESISEGSEDGDEDEDDSEEIRNLKGI